MSWGEGGKWDHTTLFPLKHYYERYSEAWTLSYRLSDQYGAGFRASGSEDRRATRPMPVHIRQWVPNRYWQYGAG